MHINLEIIKEKKKMDMWNPVIHEIADFVSHETGFIVASLFGGVLLYFYKRIKKIVFMLITGFKSRFNKTIPAMIQRDMEIYNQLFDIKAKTEADRVFIFQFHNGSYYTNSASQMKMSCTHEVVSEGISRESRNMQDLILSQFAAFTGELINESFVVLNRDNIDKYSFGMLLRSQGAKTAAFSLFTYDGIVEGFLGIVYLDDVPMDRRKTDIPVQNNRRKDHSEGCIASIAESYASRIGFLLRRKL